MKKDIKEDEVYFLGQKGVNKRFQKKNRLKQGLSWLPVLVMALVVIGFWMMVNGRDARKADTLTLQGELLDTVSVLPPGARMPRFKGSEDVSGFVKWITENLRYPEGYEEEGGLVVIGFLVQANGELGEIKVLKSPGNKAFEEAVIGLLQCSPQWEPAELANGEKVNMKFTLPVLFGTAN